MQCLLSVAALSQNIHDRKMNREGRLYTYRYKLKININRTVRYLNVSVFCFFFDGPFSKVIALPTFAIAIVVPLSCSERK